MSSMVELVGIVGRLGVLMKAHAVEMDEEEGEAKRRPSLGEPG